MRAWTSPEILRASRGRVGRRRDLRATGARKFATAVLAAAHFEACREASVGLAQLGYRTRRLLAEQSPKRALLTTPRGVRRSPPPCVEWRRSPPWTGRGSMRRWLRERRHAMGRRLGRGEVRCGAAGGAASDEGVSASFDAGGGDYGGAGEDAFGAVAGAAGPAASDGAGGPGGGGVAAGSAGAGGAYAAGAAGAAGAACAAGAAEAAGAAGASHAAG